MLKKLPGHSFSHSYRWRGFRYIYNHRAEARCVPTL